MSLCLCLSLSAGLSLSVCLCPCDSPFFMSAGALRKSLCVSLTQVRMSLYVSLSVSLSVCVCVLFVVTRLVPSALQTCPPLHHLLAQFDSIKWISISPSLFLSRFPTESHANRIAVASTPQGSCCFEHRCSAGASQAAGTAPADREVESS